MAENNTDLVRPYLHEPLALDETALGVDWSSESEDESAESSTRVADDASSSSTCQCGKCEVWAGQKEMEKKCCHFYPEVLAHVEDGQSCITEHEGVFVNCLSRYSIDSTIVLLKQKLRSYYKNEVQGPQPHSTYRHVAYSNFVRWIWRTTGKNKRKILPACLVAAIRRKFPSQEYVGFKYAV